MPTLTLDSVGPGATIQDGGRHGWLRFGVTPAGPMDWVAHETANRALGNAPDAASIEIGPGGLALTVDAPLPLAFAGGGFAWSRAGHRTAAGGADHAQARRDAPRARRPMGELRHPRRARRRRGSRR